MKLSSLMLSLQLGPHAHIDSISDGRAAEGRHAGDLHGKHFAVVHERVLRMHGERSCARIKVSNDVEIGLTASFSQGTLHVAHGHRVGQTWLDDELFLPDQVLDRPRGRTLITAGRVKRQGGRSTNVSLHARISGGVENAAGKALACISAACLESILRALLARFASAASYALLKVAVEDSHRSGIVVSGSTRETRLAV